MKQSITVDQTPRDTGSQSGQLARYSWLRVAALPLLAMCCALLGWAPAASADTIENIGSLLPEDRRFEREGVSRRYAKERWLEDRRTTSPMELSLDVGGTLGWNDTRLRHAPRRGSNLKWSSDEFDGDEFLPGLEARLSFRLSWYDYVTFDYRGNYRSAANSPLPVDVETGRSVIPAGSDIDARLSVQRFNAGYRRDLFFFDEFETRRIFVTIGIQYDLVRFTMDSDAFPVADTGGRMKELLPLPVAGLGFEWAPSKSYIGRISARGIWLPEVTTLQHRRSELVRQESWLLEATAENEWRITSLLAVGCVLRYQFMEHALESKVLDHHIRSSDFSAGLRIGVRL